MHTPDTKYDPRDPKTPVIQGRPLLSATKLVPKEIGHLEIEGSSGVLVTPQALQRMPPYATQTPLGNRSGIVQTPQGTLFMGDCLGIPLFEVGAWAAAFEHRIGAAPPVPYWYADRLREHSRLPFSSPSQVPGALQKHGWREKIIPGGWELTKVVNGRKVTILNFHGDTLFLNVLPPTKLSPEQTHAFLKEVRTEIEVTGSTAQDINKQAEQLVKRAVPWQPKRTKPNLSVIQWGGFSGREALLQWQRDVERVVPNTLSRKMGTSTQGVVDDLFNNRGFDEITGVPRHKMGVLVRGILDRLATRGVIERDTNDPARPKWWLP